MNFSFTRRVLSMSDDRSLDCRRINSSSKRNCWSSGGSGGAHIALGPGFVCASLYILHDLRHFRQSRNSIRSISGVLTATAGAITVAALLIGLRAPSDPKSLFGAFYVFVFYFACAVWALESRISSAELTAREQSLRIEYRLADLAERLEKR